MHPTRIDIPLENRVQLVKLLNERLADALDLGMQAKQAHWNVKGPNFIALHELFDDIAEALEENIDTIAERITALGGVAEGTIGAVAGRTKLPAYKLDITDGRAHIETLAASLAAFGKSVRAAIEESNQLSDADTSDLFTGVSRDIDKHLWFVEAHVQSDR